ncbi:MAG: flagellar protein FlgN [Nitrospirae bacterium]|nr:flagellar protein FlgN [Nitrospirota bacterium]
MPQTESLVSDLIETLDQEQLRLDALRHLLTHEQEAVRRWSLDDLSAVTTTKMGLLEDLHTLERRRADLVAQLGTAWNQSPDTLTLNEIAARVPPAQAAPLLQRRTEIRHKVQDALVTQDVTQMVVAHAMDLCDEMMRLANQVPGTGPLYSDAGLVTAGSESRTWVNRKG